MRRKLLRIKRSVRKRRHDYQNGRIEGTAARWQLIESRITEAKSLLDVGCNMGLLTAMAARSGLSAIGIEVNEKAIAAARRQCNPDLPLTFLNRAITPANARDLPVCDVVLCLSVYHQWQAVFGYEGAQHILRTLGSKARQVMFFESASQKWKYGSSQPDFIDCDQISIVDYNLTMLGALFGRPNVKFIKATTASRGEKFRCLFAIRNS